VPVETVVRSLSGGLPAATARPVIGIFFVRLHLQTLTKREADKSCKDNECEERPTQFGTINSIKPYLMGVRAFRSSYLE
jgi:hypothetical protein